VYGSAGQTDDLLAQAIALHQEGKLELAERLYRRILAHDSRQADAWHLLGQIARSQGDPQRAVESIGEAIRLRGEVSVFHYSLANALRDLARPEEAITAYRQALVLKPDLAGAHNGLGCVLLNEGKIAEAKDCFQQALMIDPALVDAWSNIGIALKGLGQVDEAFEAYRRALSLAPDSVAVLSNLGTALQDRQQWGEARRCYERALAIDGRIAEVHCNLGAVLSELGEYAAAERHLRSALLLRPDYPVALVNLSHALFAVGKSQEGEQAASSALALAPDSAVVNRLLSVSLFKQQRLAEARDLAERAVACANYRDLGLAMANLAPIYCYMSDFSRAVELSDEALSVCPRDPVIWAQRLYSFSYHPDLSAEEIFGEFVRWGEGQKCVVPAAYGNSRELGRRLRVGFVSPDFRRHTSRFYFSPLFEYYDREQIEFIAYSNVLKADDWTEKFRGWVDGWRDIRGLSDEAVAAQVKADGIDILIDGCNHMQDHRLGVFTLKPAPIQVTWLGAAWTTGLPTVDYVLFDPYMAPEGTLAREKIVWLPGCFIAYRPPEEVGDVAPLPALKNGYITFGYSGRTERLNHKTFRAWGEILKRLPDARLILDYGPFADPPTQDYYREFLGAHGVDVSRVEMRNSSNIFAGLADIDILLDCFPHSGGTMLFDALWMGVPAVTLSSRPPVGRIGTSLMMNLGLSEWVTHGEEEYIARAVEFAKDIGKLGEIRAGMRERMRHSPLMDEKGFARDYGKALRLMWHRWCDGLPTAPFDVEMRESERQQDGGSRTEQQLDELLAAAVGHHCAGHLDQAEQLYRQVVTEHPRHASALHLLGVIAHQRGQQKDAFDMISQAIALNPEVPDYHSNLGNVLKAQGKQDEAVASYERAIALKPDFAMALSNLGNSYAEMGRLEQAVEMCEKALASDPTFVAAYLNCGNALAGQHRVEACLAKYRKGLEFAPNDVRLLIHKGIVHVNMGQLAQARLCLERALQIEPKNVDALNNLGVVFKDQCRFDEALKLYAQVQAVEPNNPDFGGNRLFCLNYHPDVSAEAVFEEYRQWNLRYAQPLLQVVAYDNSRDMNRRLRIGYVSPDFRRHAARHFIEPLLAGHDKAAVEVFAYAEVAQADDVSEQLRVYVDCWRGTAGLSDEELARQIRADGIDILVDLAGHTRGNRLLVFARKPAPIQVSWLGYAYTTGLKAIDYFLGDSTLLPAGCEHLFSETLVRLPVCLTYRPPVGVELSGGLPALSKGYVTFGSLSRSVRINHRVVKVWAELLRRVPNSRLVINSGTFTCPEQRQQYIEQFAVHGIAAERLELGYDSPPWGVLQRIDIALDCFPHNSGTTLFESLHMGIPFVTLKDRPSVGRMGAAILSGLGRTEWVAETEEEYICKAEALAADLNALAVLRAGLREEMQASRLMDEAGFAWSVETAYRTMWRRWCEGKAAEPFEVRTEAAETVQPSLAGDIKHLYEAAVTHHRAGRLAEAEESYRRVLVANPDHADSYHLLAVIAYQRGSFDVAAAFFGQALSRRDDIAEYHSNFSETLRRLGRVDEALVHAQQALAIEPEHINATINLGAVLADMGQFAEAETWMKKAVVLSPCNPGTHYNYGITLKKLNRLEEARQCFERALALHPNYVDALFQMGSVFELDGALETAATWYDSVLVCQPNHAEALNNLGVALQAQGRAQEAESLLRRAVVIKPGTAEIHCNLGIALNRNGKSLEALQHMQKAIALNPNSGGLHSNMASVLNDLGRGEEAERLHRKALELDPGRSASNRAYSVFLWKQRRFVEARRYALRAAEYGDKLNKALGQSQLAITDAYLSNYPVVKSLSDEALSVCPRDPVIWSQRLYTFSYHPDLTAEEIFGEFVRWGEGQKCVVPAAYGNSRELGRRLRVGFVSPDFRRHTSRFYFSPLFEYYDREQIEFIAYSNVLKADDWTEKFRGWVDGWRDIRGLSDEAVAAQVKADGIDILIDGCNHMQDHRLGVFTLKPAPIQVTWLGAAWTTGLPTVDYVLFDPYMAPEGTLAREKIVWLPGCFIAYRPPEEVGDVAPLPALKNGYITFGYSGRTERLNHKTFRAWGEILKRLPDARLILDYGPFADPPTQDYYREFLGAHGVDVSRVEMRNSSNIFAGLADIDILLDCFPHSGGTMLFDALWMGVPAVTLSSRPPVGRIGTSLMMNLGLSEWVTHGEEEYIARAVEFAKDIGKLGEIRAGMRERMRHSPLMDEKGFARDYGKALRLMWEKHVATESPIG